VGQHATATKQDETVNFDLKKRYRVIWRQVMSTLLLMLGLGVAQSGWAQSAPALVTTATSVAGNAALPERYPPGSITAVATADTALADAGRERALIDVELIRQERICYTRFFVSSCLNKVRAEHRTESKKIKNIEIEANTYLRQARADDRDAALAQQRAQELADAPRRAEEQKKNAIENARKVEESTRRSAEADARAQEATPSPDQRIADHEKKMQQVRAQQEADAKVHDANVAAYNKKVQDAKNRQKEVAAKKAEKAADQAAQRAAGQK
jgi:colicin import membrane protein